MACTGVGILLLVMMSAGDVIMRVSPELVCLRILTVDDKCGATIFPGLRHQ